MGASNFTPNYQLPQWLNGDKPSWLGDMNTAFSDIDTGIKNAQTTAQNGLTTAQETFNKITDTLNLLQENIDKINALALEMENFNGFLTPFPSLTISLIESNCRAIAEDPIVISGSLKLPILHGSVQLKSGADSYIEPSGITRIYPLFNIASNIFNLNPGDFATWKNVIYVGNTLGWTVNNDNQNQFKMILYAVYNGGYTRFAIRYAKPNEANNINFYNMVLPITGKQIIYNQENTNSEV